MSKRLVLKAVFLGLFTYGCSSSSSPPAPPINVTPPPPPVPSPVPPEDVSGKLFSRTMNNAVNCGNGEIIDAQTISIAQDDTAITVLTSHGNVFSGTVDGDIVEWEGSYDERGGTTTFTSFSMTVSGSTAAGNAAWTWSDGTDSCNGTMDISASRDWSVGESSRNSRPGIADALTFTDGVAFITGSSISLQDNDYFSFAPAADGVVQAELSHFDLQTSDLDLEILDANFNQIAFSSSVDGFEMVEAQVLSGQTYYIGVLSMSTPGDAPYNLSIDLN